MVENCDLKMLMNEWNYGNYGVHLNGLKKKLIKIIWEMLMEK